MSGLLQARQGSFAARINANADDGGDPRHRKRDCDTYEGPRAGMDCVSLDAQLIHTATISTRRPSANKARIMKLALISMVGVHSFACSTSFNAGLRGEPLIYCSCVGLGTWPLAPLVNYTAGTICITARSGDRWIGSPPLDPRHSLSMSASSEAPVPRTPGLLLGLLWSALFPL